MSARVEPPTASERSLFFFNNTRCNRLLFLEFHTSLTREKVRAARTEQIPHANLRRCYTHRSTAYIRNTRVR